MACAAMSAVGAHFIDTSVVESLLVYAFAHTLNVSTT